MPSLHQQLDAVTDRIRERSKPSRDAYLQAIHAAARQQPQRAGMSCTNLAHVAAAAPANDKFTILAERQPNLAIVSAYNDMLSAHQPFAEFPHIIKQAARDAGAVAQFAGGVPAMCDGVTQGTPGMELSLFSRDTIAMATCVALSHNVFDAALYLGVCDKIVPGLLIGALQFGHLPAIFVPAGPMTSGLSNTEKAQVRQRFAEGLASREELQEAESKAYHSAGTCTFYGTANSNQMLMEIMGLHLPGSAFINPGTPLREALTKAAAQRALQITTSGKEYTPVGELVDEKAVVNAIVGLMATGGSTNHTMHLVAIARAAGISIDWNDFSDISKIVPLLARVYPNGKADVNQFHAAGGLGLVIRQLLDAGLLHENVATVASGGRGLRAYTDEPFLDNGVVGWRPAPDKSFDAAIIGTVDEPFDAEGGLQVLSGNLGRAVIKVSALADKTPQIEAPARLFDSQRAFLDAFENNALEGDFVAVVRFQGPRANGMPELHKLVPALGVLQDRGQRIALLTDGRMSGASGKVPAAIHVTPESAMGGPIARIRDGDIIKLDCAGSTLDVLLPSGELDARPAAEPPEAGQPLGLGRDIYTVFRQQVNSPEQGASIF